MTRGAQGGDPSKGSHAAGVGDEQCVPARERILGAACELFAEHGFDATPTSRIAEQAEVPKGLIHYYFRRKQDLLVALVDRLPDETVDSRLIVVHGDLTASLCRLVRELDTRVESSLLLSHLLWREADTHAVVRQALQSRLLTVAEQISSVIEKVVAFRGPDVETAARLLARVISHRHSESRHGEHDDELEREIGFVARALELGAVRDRARPA
ncbi:TetR/AcrR family transcriptional regulator [Parasphingorhabdus pacifica]